MQWLIKVLNAAWAPMAYSFITLVLFSSLSGPMLWWLHGSGALLLLLGAVIVLFSTLPCGQFAHGVFHSSVMRCGAMRSRRVSGTAPRSVTIDLLLKDAA